MHQTRPQLQTIYCKSFSARLSLDGSSTNTVYSIAADGTVKNALTQTNSTSPVSVSEIHRLGNNIAAYATNFLAPGDLTGTAANTGASLGLTTVTVSPGPKITAAQAAADATEWANSSAPNKVQQCALAFADSTGVLNCADFESLAPQAASTAMFKSGHYLQNDEAGNIWFVASPNGTTDHITIKKFDPTTGKSTAMFAPVATLNEAIVGQDGSLLYSATDANSNYSLVYIDATDKATTVSTQDVAAFAKMPNDKIYFLTNGALSAFDMASGTVEATPAVVGAEQNNSPQSGQSYTQTNDYEFTNQIFVSANHAYDIMQNGDTSSLNILAEIYPTPGQVTLSTMTNVVSATAATNLILLVGTDSKNNSVLSVYDMEAQTETAAITAASSLTGIASVSMSGSTVIFSGTNAAGNVTGTVDMSQTPPAVTMKAASTALSSVAAVN